MSLVKKEKSENNNTINFKQLLKMSDKKDNQLNSLFHEKLKQNFETMYGEKMSNKSYEARGKSLHLENLDNNVHIIVRDEEHKEAIEMCFLSNIRETLAKMEIEKKIEIRGSIDYSTSYQ